MLTRIASSLALVAVLAATAAAQEERPGSFLEGSVTFDPPAAWVVGQFVNTATRGSAFYTIPNPNAGKSKQAARVSLVARVVAPNVTVRDESDGVYRNKYEGLAVLSDTFDGDEWRTIVWTFKADTPMLVLDRYGVSGGKAVQLWAALPLSDGGDKKWLEKAVADFNAACATLKIDGRGRFAHKVEWKKINAKSKVRR